MSIVHAFSFALLAAAMILTQAQGQQPNQPQPTQDSPGLVAPDWQLKVIPYDKVVGIPEPDPVTIAEKVALKFKPQIAITTGCDPFPAVNRLGEISSGLPKDADTNKCQGPLLGSQIYGRSTWYNDAWVTMFAWYFLKDSPFPFSGHRHDWENVVIYINDPSAANPQILGCSASYHSGYIKYAPCPTFALFGNTSLKVIYEYSFPLNHALNVTEKDGTFQDLIMWEQLTPEARQALNTADFGAANVPMNEANFLNKVEKAYPFKK